ncbi:class I SAM-dependent methyltransferase [Alienimonas californiensis]|uniref:Methyltransferase domain protein n=1 Tax=Alienimonas californiensis TaxID=2527989 RepID=A0A517PAR8_9PLAN|nr:class I SAM-dependent methyltransferase [Alienimonas californiensis]QDT16451.1 Methyltransferase domain protein [Alienimonas californiensis]
MPSPDAAAADPGTAERIQRRFEELTRQRELLNAELERPRSATNPRIDAACHAVLGLVNRFRGELPVFAADPTLSREARGRFEELRRAGIEWPAVQGLVKAQAAGRRRRLLPRPPASDSLRARQTWSTDDLIAALQDRLTAEQDPAGAEHGCFADIPLPHSEFVALVQAARRAALVRTGGGPIAFLDVGCGCGLKLLAAVPFFDRVTGIEIDPRYAAAGRRLLDGGVRRTRPNVCAVENADVQLIHGDALEFPDYRRFDAVYFYRPMRDDEKLYVLERRIVEQVRPGTLLIAPYRGFEARFEQLGCARVEGWLYLAGADERAARRLRRQAESLGAGLRRDQPPCPGFWEPILAALARRGFVLPNCRFGA